MVKWEFRWNSGIALGVEMVMTAMYVVLKWRMVAFVKTKRLHSGL